MTLGRVFDEIEGSNFASAVNVASGIRIAAKAALHHPLVERLKVVLPPGRGAEAILGRVLEVAKRAVDPRFENPYDAALMTYLLLLEGMNPALAQVGSAEVLLIPSTWWSGRVASRIAGAGRVHNNAGSARAGVTTTNNTAVADSTAFIGVASLLQHGAALLSGPRGIQGNSGSASSEGQVLGRAPARVFSRATGSGALAA